VSEELVKSKILLVDDTPENLALLQETLEPVGYELFVATSGEKALQIVWQIKPNLILLDIMMPGIDGYETCKMLKSDKETKDIPVIFLSALDNPKDKIKAFETGGVDYISKPFNHLEVLARVKTHLQINSLINSLNELIKKSFHEIYTPLGIINTGVEMQELEYGNTEYLDSIKAASRSLHAVYEDIYYSMRKEIIHYEPQQINLQDIIQDRINYFLIIAKTKNIDFKTVFEIKEPIIFINSVECERVIDNTISNSIKYGYENSVITIRIFEDKEKLCFSVENIGKTIKNKEKVFKQLYREDLSKSGFGIGLDVVRMICDKYKIQINVDSKDKKTKFTYCFKG